MGTDVVTTKAQSDQRSNLQNYGDAWNSQTTLGSRNKYVTLQQTDHGSVSAALEANRETVKDTLATQREILRSFGSYVDKSVSMAGNAVRGATDAARAAAGEKGINTDRWAVVAKYGMWGAGIIVGGWLLKSAVTAGSK